MHSLELAKKFNVRNLIAGHSIKLMYSRILNASFVPVWNDFTAFNLTWGDDRIYLLIEFMVKTLLKPSDK